MTINPDPRWNRQQDEGVTPSGPDCQPTASAAEEASSQSGIPNAVDRDDPKRHLPLDPEEKLAAFIIYIRALEAAGLSPGYGRISRDEGEGVDFSFGLPNFMARNAILTAPETVAEAAEILAQNASADTRPEGGDSTKIEAPFTSGAVPHEDAADAQTPSP